MEVQRLAEFAGRDFKEILRDIAGERRALIIPGRHHGFLDSCAEKADGALSRARTDLLGNQGVVRMKRLAVSGLTGAQLEFKLGVFYDARGEYLDFVCGVKPTENKERIWIRRLMSLAKNVLDAARVIVGSLAKAIPWLEAVGEIIDALVAAISIQESRLQPES